MNATITIALLASISKLALAELTPFQEAAKRKLEATSQMEEYRGSVYAQAKIDGIDYRSVIKKATSHDRKALESLFALRFTGEGAETHCSILLDLMRFWGDAKFAEALATQTKEIRDLVIGSIDYSWADPEWPSFPLTLALSPSSVKERPKPNKRMQATSVPPAPDP